MEPDTNKLLQEILATQREMLEVLRQTAHTSEQSSKTYEENTKLYRESDTLYRDQFVTKPWETAVRIAILLGILVLLGYAILK